MMRLILCVLLLACASAHAELVYSPTAGSGYKPLNGATIRGKVNIRATGLTPPVRFQLDAQPVWTENSCPCDYTGDPNLWDSATVPDGLHTMAANGAAVTFTVDNLPDPAIPAPPPPPVAGDAVLSWGAVSTNTDGSAAKIIAYLVHFGTSSGSYGTPIRTTQLTHTFADLAPGTYYFAVQSVRDDEALSTLTPEVSATVEAPAPPPVDVCVSNPIKLTVTRWPTSCTGSRSLTYATDKPYVREIFDCPSTVTVIDSRGCEASVTR